MTRAVGEYDPNAVDVLSNFPTTHATWLATRIDDGGVDAMREARVHLMERYRSPLLVYAATSRCRSVDEPSELVHDFFAAKVGDAQFLAQWQASAKPLRQWILNGFIFHVRGVVRDRVRDAMHLARHDARHLESSTDAEDMFERAWAFALVESACRKAQLLLAHEGRARAYDCFHRHFFDGREYAQLATEHGVDASVIAADIRHAMRRTRAATESILREELGSADPHLIAAELERIRALTGRRL
jgi:hypothetical protein